MQPASGRSEWLRLPTVTAEVFTIALAHFAEAVGSSKSKRILLVLDQTGWHKSPQLQPCERLWPLTNEGVANRSFPTLEDLEAAQAQGCVVVQNQPDTIRSLTHFHWWPPAHSKYE